MLECNECTKIRTIISEKLLVRLEAVKPTARLVEDLGADSLNILDIIMDITEAFDIDLPPEEVARVRKVGDLYCVVNQVILSK